MHGYSSVSQNQNNLFGGLGLGLGLLKIAVKGPATRNDFVNDIVDDARADAIFATLKTIVDDIVDDIVTCGSPG